MKRFSLFLIFVLVISCFTACMKTSISTQGYNEISNYILENKDSIITEKELEFFDYEATGLTVGGVYYLFVRGMSPQQPQRGVFQARPPWQVIQSLEELICTGMK